jgi:hypothetical protein
MREGFRYHGSHYSIGQATMTSSANIIENIANSKPVRVFLPILASKERYRAHCVYQKTSPPQFNLLFTTGILPVDSINLTETAIISIDMGGPNLSLEAKIKAIASDQVLEMVMVKSISHAQMREFFRVDATTSVIGTLFQPEVFGEQTESWSLTGRTIDISGSGILVIFPDAPPKDKQIRLEITLPTKEPETISVLARSVRLQRISDKQFEVAYHFEDISTEDRDKIIGCCLVLQRKLLRLKVHVKDHEIQ